MKSRLETVKMGRRPLTHDNTFALHDTRTFIGYAKAAACWNGGEVGEDDPCDDKPTAPNDNCQLEVHMQCQAGASNLEGGKSHQKEKKEASIINYPKLFGICPNRTSLAI